MSDEFKDTLKDIATDEELHLSNLYIFSKMNPTSLDIFREVWPTIPFERRRAIIENLVEIAEVNFEVDFDPVFLLGMGDEDAEVRSRSINGLWENESPALIGPLLHLLHTDETVLVRSSAATSLGQFLYMSEIEELNPAQAAPIKTALLDTVYQTGEDIEVRRRAVESLAFLSDPGINQIIESAYYDENPKMRVSAVFAMGRNADESWRSLVVKELDSDDSEIKFEAARACGELEASEAVGKLIMLINDSDSDSEVQTISIWSLGRIGGQTAQTALETYIESDNEAIALAAEEAMEELNLFGTDLNIFDFDDQGVNDIDLDKFGGGLDVDDIDLDDLDDFNHYLN